MVERVVGNDQCRWVDRGYSRLLITDLVHGGVAEQAGIKDGDFLIAINGQQFNIALDAQSIINKYSGSKVTYTIDRGGNISTVEILILKSINLGYLSQFLLGLGFLLVGYIVVMVKPLGKIQRMFARFSILAMLFFGLSTLNQDLKIDPMWRIYTLGVSFVLASVFALPVFVRFFLFFPIKRKGHDSWKVLLGLYVLSLILIFALLFFSGALSIRWIANVAFFSRYGFFLTGFIIFIHSYFWLIPHERRNSLRPVLFGVALGIVVFSYALAVQAINPFAAFLNPTILLPVLLLVMVPVFFGYAIFRHRLMDMDVVIRRSLIYGAVTTSLAAVYLVFVYGIGTLTNYLFGMQDNQMIVVVSLVVIAFIFDPFKQRFQNSIDQIFFRERYDYQRALLEFTQELPRLMGLDHILHSIVSRLSTTMHIERIMVFICGEKEGCTSVARNVSDLDCTFHDGDHTLMMLLRKTHQPVDLHLLGDEYDMTDLNEDEKQKILHSGIVLSVPMFLQERLVGFINVGPKKSGKVYSQEDMNLLATVAGQAAIAIDNSRLHQSEIKQQRIQEELDLARKIQQGLFPKADPKIAGLEISGVSIPATSVGGDYYDFIQLNKQKILAVVADVSGKGMSAALYMSKIQGMVHLAAHMYDTPREMLININRRIFEGLDRKSFITMILALFDLKKKEVRICRAGHNKALVGDHKALKFLEGAGIGLGLERGKIFEDTIEEIRIALRSQRVFLFYTDGIPEAMNESNQQLGENVIVDILQKNQHRTVKEIQQSILNKVDKFRGTAEQHDDITMVVVKTG